MIKPNTLCMIRGVPQDLPGSEFNGNIVTAVNFKDTHEDGSPIYWIEPVLQDSRGLQFTGCREQWLFPFSSPYELALTNTNKTLETA